MRSTTCRTCLLTALAFSALMVVGFAPAPAAAQSLLSAGGLGLPTDAVDARSRALGGASVGLPGAGVFPADPASVAGIFLPGISASMEASASYPEEGADSGATRFPALAIMYPIRGNVFTATLTGVISQGWNSQVTRTLELGGSEVEARDSFEGRGGVSTARLGVSRTIGEGIAVGVAAGSYTGSIERQFVRELNPADVGPEVEPFGIRGVWRASGLNAIVGANWRVNELIKVGGSLLWGGDLELGPTAATDAEQQTIPMPTELRVGASGTLAPGLNVAVETSRADWTDAAGSLGNEGAPGVAWSYGGGIEWNRVTLLGRLLPLAVGYRQRDLPFSFLGEPATERAFTSGIGAHLVDSDPSTPLARLHLSLEAGTRSSGSWEESFLRTTLSLRLSGR